MLLLWAVHVCVIGLERMAMYRLPSSRPILSLSSPAYASSSLLGCHATEFIGAFEGMACASSPVATLATSMT